jgi:hypothetical protein
MYQASPNCMAAATAAAKGKLTEQEILEAFAKIADHKARLEAAGQMTGTPERLRRFAADEAERAKVAAKLQRKVAALNAITRVRLDDAVDAYIKAGVKPHKALLTLLEGSQANIAGSRKSISTLRQSFEKSYVGGLLAELEAEKPHLVDMLHDKKLDADILREMNELKPNGKPGITGNTDAQFIAKTFAKYAELARTDINARGGAIGKLLGWAGVQVHDDVKMIAAGKEAWVGTVVAHLDVERTFPEGLSPSEVVNVLGDIYDTIITGFPNAPTPGMVGKRVGPAGIAKALMHSRVLHFKDADAQLAYREAFGYGNVVSGMYAHLRNAARVAANMEMLGPNPEVMFTSLAETLKGRVKADTTISDRAKQRRINALTVQAGVLRQGLDIATGAYARPVNVSMSQIAADLRAWQSMSKLGGALISSLSDTITTAAAAQFRGANFFSSFTRHLAGIAEGRGQGELREISFLLGEGFDGLIGNIISPVASALDGPVGHMSRLQEKFFKWNGLTWWTDANRASAGRMIAAEMGMRTAKAFADLPPAYRHVLELNDIGPLKWDAIRRAKLRNVNGADYVTPDRIRELPDDAIIPLLGTRKVTPESIAAERRRLELDVLRFFADETNYSVIKTDARTARYMTQGLRPGTMTGEAMRFIMQFKGFPIAFTERVVGRALFGHREGAAGEKFAHMGSLIAGLTLAGYASMTMKDMLKGYWPPRDPGDVRTWIAAAQQGGAWGIYGDFLFSQTNRFGGGLAETAIGPTFGSFFDAVNIGLDARDYAIAAATDEEGRFAGGKALSWAVGNTPYANLFYVKPVIDYVVLNSLRETLSPGYLRRQARTRERQYGQRSISPLGPTLQGDLSQ